MERAKNDPEKLINSVIDYQREYKPSPYLKTRVMARVESIEIQKSQKMRRYLRLAYYLCFAVTIACSVYIGMSVGQSYSPNKTNYGSYTNFDGDEIESQFLIQIK